MEMMKFYFFIFEKSDRLLLFPLIVPDLVLSDGEAHEMVDIVSASAPSAVIQVSIDDWKKCKNVNRLTQYEGVFRVVACPGFRHFKSRLGRLKSIFVLFWCSRLWAKSNHRPQLMCLVLSGHHPVFSARITSCECIGIEFTGLYYLKPKKCKNRHKKSENRIMKSTQSHTVGHTTTIWSVDQWVGCVAFLLLFWCMPKWAVIFSHSKWWLPCK